MGTSASKTAVGAAARKYPTRTPAPSSQVRAQQPAPPTPGPSVHPSPRASTTRDAAINLDASDPHFAKSLRSLGAVQPNPTLSESSTFHQHHQRSQTSPRNRQQQSFPTLSPRQNPALQVLASRSTLQDRADREFLEAGRVGHAGREFLDVYTIRRILELRDGKGKEAGEIERVLGLRKGVVGRLGGEGVVGLAIEVGRGSQGVELV